MGKDMPVRDASAAKSHGSFHPLGIVGLTLACGLWLVLLSPKTISGLPATSAGSRKVQTQQSPQTVSASEPVMTPVALAAPLAVPDDAIPAGLQISPAQAEMTVGKTAQFRLVDKNGHAVPGATWMVSDFTVAELDSIEPARIAAVAPGQVTLTAMLGDKAVKATVTVIKSPAVLNSTDRSAGQMANGR
jgi:hypothetical protein